MNSSETSPRPATPKTTHLGLRSYEDGVWCLDSGYFRDSFDAVHLIEDNGELAVIDAGTQYSVPRILQAIESLGLTPDDVRFVSNVVIALAVGACFIGYLCVGEFAYIAHPDVTSNVLDSYDKNDKVMMLATRSSPYFLRT
ncbi:MAG: hypothetical protein ACO3SN_02610 [Burkholderiaceae bacterium]